jgi:serine/threonine protein kinase
MTGLSDRIVDRLRGLADRPDLVGTRYRFERLVGRGGLGTVYAVTDDLLGRSVAMKILPTPEDADRLMAEARVAAGLEHPGIVPLYDAGLLADGRAYFTMKLVHGRHIDAYLAEMPSLSDRLRVFQKLCDAVAFAHGHGVVHRDLKPANVMVGPAGEVLVMDWGIGVAGTPTYRAPEQAQPSAGGVGPAADVHALGVILGALLPAEAPKALRAVVTRATAAAPADRYPDAGSLNAEIGRFLDTGTVSAYRESLADRATRFYLSNQPLLVLLLVYVVARFVLFFWPTR